MRIEAILDRLQAHVGGAVDFTFIRKRGLQTLLGLQGLSRHAFLTLLLFAFLNGLPTSVFAQPTPPEEIQTEQLAPVKETLSEEGTEPADITAPADAAKEQAEQSSQDAEGDSQGDDTQQRPETADNEAAPTKPDEVGEKTEPVATGAPENSTDAAANDASEERPDDESSSLANESTEGPSGDASPAGQPSDVESVKAPETAAPSKKLRVAIWSGAFGEAQKSVVLNRFSKEKSIDVAVVERNGRDTLKLSDNAKANAFDAGLFSALEVQDGCKSGRLAKLDNGAVGAADDYLAGSLKDCGIGSFAWSHVFAANRDAFRKRKPKTLSDVFNRKRFPGKRALIKSSKFLLEAALLADGAAGEEIYELLATQEGRARAFEKLDQIKSDILWVNTPAEAMELFKSGEAVFAQTFSGRAFFAAVHGSPVDVIWDGQIYSMSYWGIAADADNGELARDFVRFATSPQQMAGVAQRFPYGPTRTAALALSKRHLTAGIDLEPFLPTTPENLKRALELDQAWWRENGSDVDAAFSGWLEGSGE